MDNEWFRKTYGFDFGEEPTLNYLRPCGILKALHLIQQESGNKLASKEAVETLEQAVHYTMGETTLNTREEKKMDQPVVPAVRIDITIGHNRLTVC